LSKSTQKLVEKFVKHNLIQKCTAVNGYNSEILNKDYY